MHKLAFLFIAFCLSITAHAQFYMSREAASEDLKFLHQQIKTYNPGLYLYNPNFDAEVEKIMNELGSKEISSFAYFTLVSKLCAASNEAHFGLGDWQDTLHSGFMNNTYRYLPMAVSIVEDQLFVWKDYSTMHAFEPGDEIVSINGQSSKLIMDRLREVTCTDGHINTHGDHLIESGFPWKYFLYIEQPEQFLIVIKNIEGIIQEHPIEAIFREQQVENYNMYYASDQTKEKEEPFADFKIMDEYAVLTLPSFDRSFVEKHEINPKKFYNSIFKALRDKGTVNLIIDLRGNSGGLKTLAEAMVPYILQDSRGNEYLYKSVSWEGKERKKKLPKAAKTMFNGQIYVLTDGGTFSSASTLTRYLNEYGNATIIGTETASRYEGYVAGSQQHVTLPHSKVVIKIPRYLNQYPPSTKQETTNRGALPDYAIEYSIMDKLEPRDKHMEKALELINARP